MKDIDLSEQAKQFKHLLEQMNVGYLCLLKKDDENESETYYIEDYNDLFKTLLSFENIEIRGKKINSIIPKEEFYWYNIIDEISQNKEPKEFEGFTSTGQQYFQIKGYISGDNQVNLLLYDWTHRIKYEEELKEKNEEINAQNEEFRALNEELADSYESLTVTNNQLIFKEKELKESNKMMQLVLDHIPARVFWKDLESNYLGCNKNFTVDAGHIQNKDVIGKNDLDLFAKAIGTLYRTDDQTVMESGKPKLNYEEPQGQEGGKERYLRTNKIPLMNEFNKVIGVLGTYEDITELKHTQQELILAKEKAEQSDRLKTAFLANMSHEIRTPMNGIIGFGQLLNDEGISGEERKQYTKIINESSQQLLRIVNDIIDVSKIESGLIEITKEEVDLRKLVEDVTNAYNLSAKEKNIKIHSECLLKNYSRQLDATKIRQVIDNLLGNAIKFTHDGYVKISIMESLGILTISVCDTGIGIAEQYHDSIFDRFTQAEKSDDIKYRGTGLGLSICRGYIEKMGGTISLDSKPNEGSCFLVELP